MSVTIMSGHATNKVCLRSDWQQKQIKIFGNVNSTNTQTHVYIYIYVFVYLGWAHHPGRMYIRTMAFPFRLEFKSEKLRGRP